MYAPVKHHAAAMLFFLSPVTGDTSGTVYSGFNSENLAQLAFCHDILYRQEIFIPTTILMYGKEFAGLFRSRAHFCKIRRAKSYRLLGNGVLASFQGTNDNTFMNIIRSCYQYDINSRICHQIFFAFIYMDALAFCIGSAFFLNIPDTCNFQVVNSLNQIIMPACHSAKADHRKSMFHVFSSFLFCRSRTLLRPCLYAELQKQLGKTIRNCFRKHAGLRSNSPELPTEVPCYAQYIFPLSSKIREFFRHPIAFNSPSLPDIRLSSCSMLIA